MLRFLLLRFLPRRLLPFLGLLEAFLLFRRWQASRRARPPARLAVSGRSRRADVTTLTPPTVDGQLYGG